MPTFASDAFTGTADSDLAGRTPDVGGVWVQHPSVNAAADFKISNANRVRTGGNGASNHLAYVDTDPGTAEYDVSLTVRAFNSSDQRVFPAARIQTGAAQCYYVIWDPGAGTVRLRRMINSTTGTTLGTWTVSLSNNTDYVFKLEIRDATKKLFVDGVERISSTDNTITGAGRAGLAGESWPVTGTNTNGVHGDNFLAETPGGAAGGPFPHFARRTLRGGFLGMRFGG